MFIRIKKLKGRDYAYLVKNTWTKKGPRQKTKKYLGRCVRPEKVKDIDFIEYYNIDPEDFVYSNDPKAVLERLFEFELIKHGFTKMKNKLVKDDIEARPRSFKIYNSEKNNVVLRINEGYLCEHMMKKIHRFNFRDEEKDPYRYADSFVAAGINIPKEVFISLYRRRTGK